MMNIVNFMIMAMVMVLLMMKIIIIMKIMMKTFQGAHSAWRTDLQIQSPEII